MIIIIHLLCALISVQQTFPPNFRSALAVAQTQAMEMKAATDRLTMAKGSEYELVLAEAERETERAIVAEGKVTALEAKIQELEKRKADGEGEFCY